VLLPFTGKALLKILSEKGKVKIGKSFVKGVDCQVKIKRKVFIDTFNKTPPPHFSLGANCAHQVEG